MDEIGRLMSRALAIRGQRDRAWEVKADVRRMCAGFPLYASRLEAYEAAIARA